MIDRDWKSSVRNACAKPGADSDTDHMLVTGNIRLKAIKVDKSRGPTKFDLEKNERLH